MSLHNVNSSAISKISLHGVLNARLLLSATPHQILHGQARGYMHAAFFRDKSASIVLLEAVIGRASMRLCMTPQRSIVTVSSSWSVTFCFEVDTCEVRTIVVALLVRIRIRLTEYDECHYIQHMTEQA